MPFTALKTGIAPVILGLALALGLAGPAVPARAETVTVGGTGSATPLIAQFASAYQNLKPDSSIKAINPPMGSNGSIRAVLDGAIDLAMTGRALTAEEKSKGGQEWELGRTLFLLVTAKEPPPANFTVEQLAAIYRGEVTTWADGSPIRLVLRDPKESDTLLLRKLSPAMDQAVEAALARPGMPVAANDIENLEVLEKTPGSLGTTNLGLLQSRSGKLQAVPINGVAPTLVAMNRGAYPYSKSINVARGSKLSPAAQDFLEFIRSASGQAVLERAGYAPAARQP